MTIASTLVNDALQFLNVSSGIMPADPGEQQRAFTTLKRLFDMLPSKNIYLEMQRPATVNANLREPGWSTEHLVVILAKHAAPYFQADLSQGQMELYDEAMNELRRRTGKPVSTMYPANLPLGGGNLLYGDQWEFYYPGQNEYQYTLFDQRKVGEAKIYTVDFSTEADRRNTTVSSVAWSNIGDEDATISGETLSGNIAQTMLTFGQVPGLVIVKARATFANGEIYDGILRIDLIDPESVYLEGDRG